MPETYPQSFRPILTVSQLTAEIRGQLEKNFPYIWVEGELSNLRQPGSGHLYFTLKDETAQIRAVMFRLQSRLLKFEPADGRQVICFGRITVYEARGEYQIVVDYLEPKGWGSLQMAFQQLKEKLAAEGLFDPARKKPLPQLPRKIGIVTSPTGAALRDILQVLNRRFANVTILIYPVRVQGPGAAAEIARGIHVLNQWPGVDVLIVGRGGGSLEDLWAFNEEVVARAIFDSRVPVISAVGHEIDFTIADFVADLRAPTPSAAAELVIRSKLELQQNLRSLEQRLRQAQRKILEPRRECLSSLRRLLVDPRRRMADRRLRLDTLAFRMTQAIRRVISARSEGLRLNAGSLLILHPGRRLAGRRERLEQCSRLLGAAIRRRLGFSRQKLEGYTGRLQSLNPLAVLERGYGIVRRLPSRQIVRRASELALQDRVSVRLHQGEFSARVEEIE
ncbi:MAG: exodeoxyribonuclease VII large subunit [Deltaproteobacteria bacterium]|nr:exodeoxyribonuclease VII large subunit [Deltaproteobacteria bacterium]